MYTINEKTTATVIKAEAKNDVMAVILEALKNHYGEDYVRMIQSGTEKSKKRGIGVIQDTLDTGTPVVVEVSLSTKDFENKTTPSGKVVVPFDFALAAAEYDEYIAKKAEDAKNKAAK